MDRILLLFWSLAVVCSSFTVVMCDTEVTREFLDALREIESVGAGGVCAVGDFGQSLGAYQIMKAYHTDAVQQNPDLSAGGKTYTDVWGEGSVDYSEEVIRAYMCRYATEARLGRPPTYEDMARIHNGGPNGFSSDRTRNYWLNFQFAMRSIERRGTKEPPVLDSDKCKPRCESGQCCRRDDRGQYRCFCLEAIDRAGIRHIEKPCEDCPVAGIDLMFVLDSSGSIGSGNFQLMREFVANITTILDIGPADSQVGVIAFSDSARVEFNLSSNENFILSAIDAIPYIAGGTNTADALNLVLTQGFLGARPTEGIPRVVIVVTDGISNDATATAAAAQAIHEDGITVFAAGIGNANIDELNATASRPEFVQLIGSFDTEELQQLQEALSEEACRASIGPDIGVGFARSLGTGRKAFFEYQVPEPGFTMEVEVTKGSISICGSREIERPDCSHSPTYDWKRDINMSTDLYINGDGLPGGSREKRQTTVVHITVEGLENNNTFSLNTTFGDITTVFNFTSSLYNVIELAEAEVIVQIEEGSLLADAQVTVRTLGGSATANVDYSSTTCRLIFPSGSGPGAMRSCFIPILGDELVEDAETINIVGSSATTVLPFTTTVVITDIDVPDLFFTGDTPRLGIGTVTAELFTISPGAQISCRLLRSNLIQDCSNGSVVFTNVPAGGYILQVVATDRVTGDRAETRTRLFVPGSEEFCSVNAINRLVSVSGNTAFVEFSSTGNPTGFRCSVDRQPFFPCTSPVRIDGLDSGRHRLRVTPSGCGRAGSDFKGVLVHFNI